MPVMDQLVAVQLQLHEVTNVPTHYSQRITQITTGELQVRNAPVVLMPLGILMIKA